MLLTDYLERNARLYGLETALVEINPSEERDQATTWRDMNLIESANPDAPYRREISWGEFDRRANKFANLLLSRGGRAGNEGRYSADELPGVAADLLRHSQGGLHRRADELPLFRR